MTIYYGHTYPGDKTKRRWQLMKAHASEVATRAKDNAEPFGEGDRAHLGGLLHDLGKYGDLFQRRLLGLKSGLDHWSVGACCTKQAFRDTALTLVIQGHHIGLQSGDAETLRELTLANLKQKHPRDLRLTEPEPDQTNIKKLVRRLHADGVKLPNPKKGKLKQGESAADMLDTRMLPLGKTLRSALSHVTAVLRGG